MYLYFIASKSGEATNSSGTIENDFLIETSEQFSEVIAKYKEYVVNDVGCRAEDIAITQFNRLN